MRSLPATQLSPLPFQAQQYRDPAGGERDKCSFHIFPPINNKHMCCKYTVLVLEYLQIMRSSTISHYFIVSQQHLHLDQRALGISSLRLKSILREWHHHYSHHRDKRLLTMPPLLSLLFIPKWYHGDICSISGKETFYILFPSVNQSEIKCLFPVGKSILESQMDLCWVIWRWVR